MNRQYMIKKLIEAGYNKKKILRLCDDSLCVYFDIAFNYSYGKGTDKNAVLEVTE